MYIIIISNINKLSPARRFSRASEIGVYFGCLAALLGAWVGAFPILLDWRRPWQVRTMCTFLC